MSEQRTHHETDDEVVTDEEPEDVETDHLENVDDGCGCTEVWEHLSEERDTDAPADD